MMEQYFDTVLCNRSVPAIGMMSNMLHMQVTCKKLSDGRQPTLFFHTEQQRKENSSYSVNKQ
jgi:hypothetical protein